MKYQAYKLLYRRPDVNYIRCQTAPSLWTLGSDQPVHADSLCYTHKRINLNNYLLHWLYLHPLASREYQIIPISNFQYPINWAFCIRNLTFEILVWSTSGVRRMIEHIILVKTRMHYLISSPKATLNQSIRGPGWKLSSGLPTVLPICFLVCGKRPQPHNKRVPPLLAIYSASSLLTGGTQIVSPG